MIDKKGKLFGKINIIDLLFLIILVVAVVGGISRFKDSAISVESTSKGRMTFLVDEVRMPTAENITEGQELYSYDKGTYMGKIAGKTVKPFEDAVEYRVKTKTSAFTGICVGIKKDGK